MRVGLVCPYDLGAHGGVQDQVIRLSGWLGDAGHQATVIGPGICDLPGFVSAGPVTVVPANGATTPVALSKQAVTAVLGALDDVDVAHIHEPLMPQVSLTALRKAAVPLVGTFHADTSKPAEWVYKLGKPLTSRWFQRLDVITAVSPIAARVVNDTGRVRIIPNGIDVAAYAPGDKKPGSVVFLGRNDERKGLPVLLAAVTAGILGRVIGGVFGSWSIAIVAVLGGLASGRANGGVAGIVVALSLVIISKRALRGDPRDRFLRGVAHRFTHRWGTSFVDADLTGVEFTGADASRADLRGAILDDVGWDSEQSG